MYKILIGGAGKIGETIGALLISSGRYSVTLADIDQSRAQAVAAMLGSKASVAQINVSDAASLTKLVEQHDAVLSALPFFCNPPVAEAAYRARKHYLDLTEDVQTTAAVNAIAARADTASAFIPQCGLAPGFISIAANSLAQQFEQIDVVRLRVGALPIFPSNRLRYNLTWSTDGLINEYGNPCEALADGQKILLQPLEGYETFMLDGDELEAFNTSGGLGSLCETLAGKAESVNYKTIRYRGHRDLIAFLMEDLGFNDDRDTLKKIFERSIPGTPQDKVIIRAEVIGKRNGKLSGLTYASSMYNRDIGGKHHSAIQLTTAAGICAPLDLLLAGKLGRTKGVIRCEEISLKQFLENEFGALYRDDTALEGLQLT